MIKISGRSTFVKLIYELSQCHLLHNITYLFVMLVTVIVQLLLQTTDLLLTSRDQHEIFPQLLAGKPDR